jgi:hypothetical protein
MGGRGKRRVVHLIGAPVRFRLVHCANQRREPSTEGQEKGGTNENAGKRESGRVIQDPGGRFTSAKPRNVGQVSVGVESTAAPGMESGAPTVNMQH